MTETKIMMIGIIELLVVLITVSGLFLWCRSESNADRRDMQQMISAIHREIHAEMKDFHGRLCAIEERRLKRDGGINDERNN